MGNEKNKNQLTKCKSFFLHSSSVLLMVLVALCLLEGILRVKNSSMKNYDIEMWKYALYLKKESDNPLLGHEHIPSRTHLLQSVDIRINRWGLRGPDINETSAKKRRILFLGSSITLGWGVPEQFTLTQQLQSMFAQQGASVEVLNAGIGNYNAPRYVERFLTRLTALKPTDIVVHYFLRDAETLDVGGGNVLLRHSQLAVTAWVALHRLINKYHQTSLEDHYQTVYKTDSPGYIEMKQSLAKLASYATTHHIHLYLVMTPDVHNLKHYPFTYVHETIKNLAYQLGYTYVDLLPGLSNLSPEDIWAMPGDPHPNALGHQRMALAIFPTLNNVS
jgi:lysophospholipase L1-like esterase